MWNEAAAVTYRVNPRFQLYAEVLTHTSPLGNGETADGPMSLADMLNESGPVSGITGPGASELSGSETSGTIGAGWYVKPNVFLSLGLTYDDKSAVLIHPGLTISW